MSEEKNDTNLNALQRYLERLDATLPEMCRTKDLIEAGIYHSDQAACAARRRGNGPDFIFVNHRRIAYPKMELMAWLRKTLVYHNQTGAWYD